MSQVESSNSETIKPCNPTYRTTDLNIATFLMTVGFSLVDVSRQSKLGSIPRAVFCFNESKELRDNLLGYNNDSIKVSARTLLNRLRELKSLAYQITR
jgi:hypothetical protein